MVYSVYKFSSNSSSTHAQNPLLIQIRKICALYKNKKRERKERKMRTGSCHYENEWQIVANGDMMWQRKLYCVIKKCGNAGGCVLWQFRLLCDASGKRCRNSGWSLVIQALFELVYSVVIQALFGRGYSVVIQAFLGWYSVVIQALLWWTVVKSGFIWDGILHCGNSSFVVAVV